MNITLSMGDERTTVNVPYGTEVGVIREATHRGAREDIGAPGSFTFAVNGTAVQDNHVLREGDVVTFRPLAGEKGGRGK